ncbi:MAG TPA: arylamine N-acetyltransferase [bacterium]|nr:arylamine N-acetyltransferase [bacterium]
MTPFPDDPLFTVTDDTLLSRFLGTAAAVDVATICAAFARMPYENLTKIVKRDAVIGPSSAKRLPDEVISDHLAYGTGGTCFSLTAALVAVLSRHGIEAWPLLADRRYGPDTHCGALVMIGGRPHLVDPGYLIHRPVPFPQGTPVTADNRFNTVELVPVDGGRKVELYTKSGNDRKYRLTYKMTPVDGLTFGVAWESSFAWEMMAYPVLTRVTAAAHHYLQGGELRVRAGGKTARHRLSAEGSGHFIAEQMGISPDIIEKAFRLVKHGSVPAG